MNVSLDEIKAVLRDADIEGLIETGAPQDEYDSEAEELSGIMARTRIM